MTDVGIGFLRKQTAQFIALDPTIITLKTKAEITAPGGGVSIGAGPDRAEQIFKLIYQGGNPSGKVQTEDGSDKQYDFVLLGLHDAALGIGDYWLHGGVKYVVEGFLPNNEYEIKAGVKAYGEKPYGG